MKLSRCFTQSVLAGLVLSALGATPGYAVDADVAAAMVHPDRPAGDAARDEARKPAEVLAFAGLQAGMTVLEVEAGGGYYTELLSRSVGANGSVILQHAPGLMSFIEDGIDVRTANNRLSNVRVSITNFDKLDVPDNSVDMVTWIQGPHELGFHPEGVNMGDPDESFREIARVLKPGGVLLASDHIAVDGSGIEAGGTWHRIEESVVTQLATQAGLKVIKSSDLLKRADDPLNVSVFSPAVRGKTSQFIVLYQK